MMRLQNSMCWENGNCFCCWPRTALARGLGCAGSISTHPVGTRSEGTGSWELWEDAAGGTQKWGGCLHPFSLSSSLLVFATWSCSAVAAWWTQWSKFWMDNIDILACLQRWGPYPTSWYQQGQVRVWQLLHTQWFLPAFFPRSGFISVQYNHINAMRIFWKHCRGSRDM